MPFDCLYRGLFFGFDFRGSLFSSASHTADREIDYRDGKEAAEEKAGCKRKRNTAGRHDGMLCPCRCDYRSRIAFMGGVPSASICGDSFGMSDDVPDSRRKVSERREHEGLPVFEGR